MRLSSSQTTPSKTHSFASARCAFSSSSDAFWLTAAAKAGEGSHERRQQSTQRIAFRLELCHLLPHIVQRGKLALQRRLIAHQCRPLQLDKEQQTHKSQNTPC